MATTTTNSSPRKPLSDISNNKELFTSGATMSNKRMFAEINEDSESSDDGVYLTKTPAQVRGMVNRFLESKEMKKGEFCTAIQVSNQALNKFLHATGDKYSNGVAYPHALRFFQKREAKGIKPPKRQRTTKASKELAKANSVDISGVHLEGEDEGEVEVYDHCDEVRRKINQHLTKPGITAAQFCRDLSEHAGGGIKISPPNLTAFRGKSGKRAGNTTKAFYAAYVYFEKVRIAERKPKSKLRQDMEDVWSSEGGFDTKFLDSRGFIVPSHCQVYVDEFGQVRTDSARW